MARNRSVVAIVSFWSSVSGCSVIQDLALPFPLLQSRPIRRTNSGGSGFRLKGFVATSLFLAACSKRLVADLISITYPLPSAAKLTRSRMAISPMGSPLKKSKGLFARSRYQRSGPARWTIHRSMHRQILRVASGIDISDRRGDLMCCMVSGLTGPPGPESGPGTNRTCVPVCFPHHSPVFTLAVHRSPGKFLPRILAHVVIPTLDGIFSM